jgi:hypothetical protein
MSDTNYRIVVVAVSALLVALVAKLRFCGEVELPPKPPKPAEVAPNPKDFATRAAGKSEVYEKQLVRDSERAGVRPAASIESLSAVLPYKVETPNAKLEPGDTLQAAGLSLKVSKGKVKGSGRKHLILSIENQTHSALAYRIETRSSAGKRSCRKKKALPYNAMAIAAGQELKRTECLYHKKDYLKVEKVETIALPELAYHYVSSLQPERVGLPESVAAGHRPSLESFACRMLVSESTKSAFAEGRIEWRDMIDFYARHHCKTYSMPLSYKAFQRDGEQNLPVVEE